MKYVKFVVTTVLLLGSLLLLSSLETPGKGAKHSASKASRKFCGAQFGVHNYALSTCTLTVVRLSPTTGGSVLTYNVSYANGQSGLFALDPLGLQSTITVKGQISGTWNLVEVVRSSDGMILGSFMNSSQGSSFSVFGIPNTCDDIYIDVY